MSRTRLSTTVDAGLLDGARRVRSGVTDAALIDEALRALLVRHRAAEIDESYAVPDLIPQAWAMPVILHPDSARRAVEASLELIRSL